MHAWLKERMLGLDALTREQKRQLIEALSAEGAFKGKSAANYIAAVLRIGRATVYKYLKQIKETTD
jgi:predicted transcriptional regulator YheO